MSIESKGSSMLGQGLCVVVEFDTHGQSGLLVHTQNISLALALALALIIVVELEPSSPWHHQGAPWNTLWSSS